MVLYKIFFSSAKSSDCACKAEREAYKLQMGKNWLRSAMTISGTLEYNRAVLRLRASGSNSDRTEIHRRQLRHTTEVIFEYIL